MLKTTVARQDFLKKLECTAPGLSAGGMIQQSDSYIFKNGYVITFNGDLSCRLKSGLPADFAGAVKARKLLEAVREFKAETLSLSVSEGKFRAAADGEWVKVYMDEKVSLPLQEIERPGAWKPLHTDFCEGLAVVQECAGTDETRPWITCVHVNPDFVEATDNDQAARYAVKTPVDAPMMVKRDSMKKVTPMGVTEFSETNQWVHFKSPVGLIMSCLRSTEKYPDLTESLKFSKGVPTELPKGLAHAVKLAESYAKENDDKKVTIFVDLLPDEVRVRGVGLTAEYGARKPMKYAGKPMSFVIQPKLLEEIIKRHTRCEISADRLRVKAGPFSYVTCLEAPHAKPEDKAEPAETQEGE